MMENLEGEKDLARQVVVDVNGAEHHNNLAVVRNLAQHNNPQQLQHRTMNLQWISMTIFRSNF